MRYLLFLLLLAGCATAPSIAPSAVNPSVTCLNNNLMALAAASAGDCSVPLCIPAGGSCANMPTATTTVQDSQTALQNCVVNETVGVKVAQIFSGVKAQLCLVPGGIIPTPAVPVVPKAAPIPPKTEWTPPGWGCDTVGADIACCGYVGCVHPVWDATVRLPS